MHEKINLSREVAAVQIPSGDALSLPAGTEVYITQRLGGTYTVATSQGLARISSEDTDALGIDAGEEENLLIQHRGATVSKEQILYDSEVFQLGSDGSLAVILNRLRKKLGEEIQLKTVRGVGYRLLS